MTSFTSSGGKKIKTKMFKFQCLLNEYHPRTIVRLEKIISHSKSWTICASRDWSPSISSDNYRSWKVPWSAACKAEIKENQSEWGDRGGTCFVQSSNSNMGKTSQMHSEIIFNQISGLLMAQSGWYIKLTILDRSRLPFVPSLHTSFICSTRA